MKFVDHYVSKRRYRSARVVLVKWHNAVKNKVYAKRYICLLVQRHYRGVLSTVIDKWHDMASHSAKVAALAKKSSSRVNRVRLKSAFLGFHASLKQGRKGKKVAKLLIRYARERVTRGWYRWRSCTLRMRLISKSAGDMRQQIATKQASQSFEAWRGLVHHVRARNSSLDIACEIGKRGGYRVHFLKWFKETRYLRLVANSSSRNYLLLSKYFFNLRVWKDKIVPLYRATLQGLAIMVNNRMRNWAFFNWRWRVNLSMRKMYLLQRVVSMCSKAKLAVGFNSWRNRVNVDTVTRLRTASEMNLNRIRSNSSMEQARAREKYESLKKDAGLALMFMSLKLVNSNVALVYFGWQKLKSQLSKMRELDFRKESLLRRTLVSKKRKAWERMRVQMKESRKADQLVLGFEKFARVVRGRKLRRGWLGFRQCMKAATVHDAEIRLARARAVSVFVKLGFLNHGIDESCRSAWDKWLLITRLKQWFEGERAKYEEVWAEKLKGEKERVEGLLKAKEVRAS